MKTIILFLVIAMALWVTGGVAQTVTIPVGQQAPGLQGIEVPGRLMTHAEVESRFGAPLLKSDPVGEPAINFWEYDNYFVYFENDRVLHTVLRHQ